jgi:hypothetical protein
MNGVKTVRNKTRDRNDVKLWDALVENLADQYRTKAKDHFDKAKSLLDAPDGTNVAQYAALELRLCIEAVCYGLLYSFRNELSRSGFAKWQPKQVLKELLEIDRHVTTPQKMSFEDPPESGIWHDFGGLDHRFTAEWANKAHNALGSALHVPTINQLKSDQIKTNSDIDAICQKYLPEMQKVLDSQSWHLRLVGQRWKMNCDCGFEMHRRKEHVTVGTVIICSNCGRTYDVEGTDDESIRVQVRKLRWQCQQCDEMNGTNEIELVENLMTECYKCAEPTQIRRDWYAFQRPKSENGIQGADS